MTALDKLRALHTLLWHARDEAGNKRLKGKLTDAIAIVEDLVEGSRVLGAVCKDHPSDFQMWLDAARTYGIYVIFSKSSRTGWLIIREELW